VKAANIYGVAVPGHSGKAGMAALEVEPGFDPATFRAHMSEKLPAYARPIFLRIVESLAVTETFKQKKHLLAQDGFNPFATNDALYADCGEGYVPLDEALYTRISSGLMRL
jgi:fatty-acyl-CoA synthase